jgi:4-amino-4-deoxy-L-arabinose transferase-like glycosyltransferase
MLASGNWLDLSWNGAPYFNKPPFLFWAIALSFHTFGESEWLSLGAARRCRTKP